MELAVAEPSLVARLEQRQMGAGVVQVDQAAARRHGVIDAHRARDQLAERAHGGQAGLFADVQSEDRAAQAAGGPIHQLEDMVLGDQIVRIAVLPHRQVRLRHDPLGRPAKLLQRLGDLDQLTGARECDIGHFLLSGTLSQPRICPPLTFGSCASFITRVLPRAPATFSASKPPPSTLAGH